MPPVQAASDWLAFLYQQGPGFALAVSLCASGYIYGIYKGWHVPGQYYRKALADAEKWERAAERLGGLARETAVVAGRAVGTARKRTPRGEGNAPLD